MTESVKFEEENVELFVESEELEQVDDYYDEPPDPADYQLPEPADPADYELVLRQSLIDG
jgi:hypothetical protein